MAKNSETKEFDRDQIIMALVKMRIEKMATTKTMLDFLMIDLGYAQTYSYELIKEAKKKIIEIFSEEHNESFETYKARLEEIIESTKNEKLRLEAIKEMNKLLGLYKPQKVDITTDGKAINDITLIKLIEVKKDEGEEDKKDDENNIKHEED